MLARYLWNAYVMLVFGAREEIICYISRINTCKSFRGIPDFSRTLEIWTLNNGIVVTCCDFMHIMAAFADHIVAVSIPLL